MQLDGPWRVVNSIGLHHDLEKLEARRVQVLDSDWFKTDHRAVLAVLSLKTNMRYTMESDVKLACLEARRFLAKSGCRDADRLVKLGCDGASAQGKSKSTQKTGNQGDDCDRAPVEEEERCAAPRASRVELALSSNQEKEESVETRETRDQDQGVCRDGESSQENTKQAFQLEFDCETRKSRNSSHKLLPRSPLNSCGPRRYDPIRETSLDRALEKLESGLCGWNADLNEETGESIEQTEKSGKDSGCFESIASLPECLEKLAGSLSVMCWDVNFPER